VTADSDKARTFTYFVKRSMSEFTAMLYKFEKSIVSVRLRLTNVLE